eukprot:9145552-Pyramimonas_sp.AAC.1
MIPWSAAGPEFLARGGIDFGRISRSRAPDWDAPGAPRRTPARAGRSRKWPLEAPRSLTVSRAGVDAGR